MKTTYLANKLLEHLTGKSTYTKPTNTYVGLFTADPTVSGVTAGREVSGGGYTREQVTWGSAADGFIANTALVEFENMPASEIKYWGIFDASSSGNLLEYYPIDVPFKVPAGENVTIDAGNLILKER